MAKIVLSGFREFQGKLKGLPKEIMEEVDREVQDAAEQWEHLAKSDAPKDQGALAGGISTKKIPGGWEIFSNQEYSAFIEWGTRGKAKVPSSLAAYAAQFKGAAGGKNAKEMIFEWCRRKGIDPSLWFVIYRSIMIKGINPQPFFFIQRPTVERTLIQNVKVVLKTPH